MSTDNSHFIKIIQTSARILTGLVFVFSGFVKAIDPFGSAIKLEEYFEAFHIGFLDFSALPLAIVMSAVELMIGINLLALVRMKLTGWFLIAFMSFFTVLTLILALTNPVSDCGCFGDAIVMTNWQTFWKNIVIMIPAVIVFFRRNHFVPILPPVPEWIMTGFSMLAAIALSIHCIIHLPLLDFRPYKVGANIPENMIIPEGAPLDEYETILIYEKDGIREEFTAMNYPWEDTTWKWVETRQKLIKKGYEPPIHDFSITSAEGFDITEDVLADPGYTFLLVAPELEKANKRNMQEANHLAERSAELGIRFICLTAALEAQVRSFSNELNLAYGFHSTDETTLKTIVRANPGLLLLRQGTIIGKWNFRDAPGHDELMSDMTSLALTMQRRDGNVLRILVTSLVFLLAYGSLLILVLKKSKKL
ncbi:MAG: DoxX family protein [Bacteroidales bacterium]|nr:DoxX family protein [Bacteroidales bacterium]